MSHKNLAFPGTTIILFLITLLPSIILGQGSNHYQVSVNFISVGSGIDSRARNQLDEFIAKYSRKSVVKLNYNTRSWGKEGEIEYLFNLKNLKSKERKAFKDSVQVMFKENKRVQISDRE